MLDVLLIFNFLLVSIKSAILFCFSPLFRYCLLLVPKITAGRYGAFPRSFIALSFITVFLSASFLPSCFFGDNDYDFLRMN